MRMKTKGRFAVTAMIDLALHDGESPVALTGISRRQDISISYLEQLFGRLRRQGLVESVRGPGGGYRLCRGPEAITVADIVAAVDGSVSERDPEHAPRGAGESTNRLVTEELWAGLEARIGAYLAGISLKALVDQRLALGVPLRERPVHSGILPKAVVAPIRIATPNSIFALGAALSNAAA